jgi:hypothetical protein
MDFRQAPRTLTPLMARILYNDDWFEEIASRGHYETEFETVLLQEAQRLFPDYLLVEFKTPVVSEADADSRAADFALIHRDYRGWWVVEVELGHHSFEGHVLPQVRTLARAKYGASEADYLCAREPALNPEKVIEMLKGGQPNVLVIVNSPVDWAHDLRPFSARVVICQIFRNRLNKYVLRLNGEYPSERDEVVTACECEPLLHRLLAIHAPTQLPIKRGERVLLYHGGTASEWVRVDTGGKIFLHALRDHDLQPGKPYEIVKHGDGTLAIRTADKR